MTIEQFLGWCALLIPLTAIVFLLRAIVDRLCELDKSVSRVVSRNYEACIDHIYTVLTVAHDEEGKMLVDALRARKPIKKRRKKNVGQ